MRLSEKFLSGKKKAKMQGKSGEITKGHQSYQSLHIILISSSYFFQHSLKLLQAIRAFDEFFFSSPCQSYLYNSYQTAPFFIFQAASPSDPLQATPFFLQAHIEVFLQAHIEATPSQTTPFFFLETLVQIQAT